MNREPFRITPNLPAAAYKTYTIDRDRDTAVKAACADVGCAAWAHGWETRIDEASDLGKSQADYIRHQSRRTYTESRDGTLTVFRFESGQRCFQDHRTVPEAYGVRAGDWRGYLGPLRVHTRAQDWIEDFGTHQQNLADQIAAG